MKIYAQIKPFTMVEVERCYALYQSVQYTVRNNIPGAFVECGVWKGGSAMLMALALLEKGITNRNIYLYDTFEGMTKPGSMDGELELMEWERMKVTEQKNNWCYSSAEEVLANMKSTGYPSDKIILVKGKVEDTLPETVPADISLLRLDTDWYESTRHELLHLFPLLLKGGTLLIDDYGAWQGAKKAVDEYFQSQKNLYMHRIDWTGRLLIKG